MNDYKSAFNAAAADLSAIIALLGFTKYPGVDPVLRAITDLILEKAENQVLREEVAELRRDKARLDAIEDNCWDVRYGISSNADAGNSSISIEIVGRYQGVPHIRVLGENYTENLRAAIDQAMTAEACPPERPEYDDHGRPIRALLSEQEGGNDVSNHQ
ncbi:hypothetical protein [Pseudomonas aeruginosa]|uniref:hypothetical protein n=1 Tax=Pseudomonas aeruginosa TaxID=287 RepID=UPI001CBC79D9|nr:hypothetical protein [Pseudomonas aeruginosa]